MKNICIYLVIVFLALSCEESNSLNENVVKEEVENPILGKWQLQEILIDPGDDSGNYQAVTSEKAITFFKNDSISSNGNLCDLSIANSIPTKGTYLIYSLEEGLLNILDCQGIDTVFEIPYTIEEGVLILKYPCIERCEMRFAKIN